MELDHRTGQVLDARKAAGVEDNTIVGQPDPRAINMTEFGKPVGR